MVRRIYHHFREQPFVVSTGLAAFVHSTWSLGTLFAGNQPDAAISWEFVGWIVPAALIAFALDVGQIATAGEIRQGQRSRIKYLTFLIFAVATYYLQWLYMVAHTPELALANGVAARWGGTPALWRDAAIWIIPALLPISTALYTLSTAAPSQTNQAATPRAIFPEITSALPQIAHLETPLLESESDPYHVAFPGVLVKENCSHAQCGFCEWQGEYETQRQATNALNAHLAHCEKKHELSKNGHKV